MFLPLAQRLLPVDPGQQAAASSQQLAPPAPLQRITLHQEGKIKSSDKNQSSDSQGSNNIAGPISDRFSFPFLRNWSIVFARY